MLTASLPTENPTAQKNMNTHFNPDKQHTLSAPVSISGTGLHTGILVDMKLLPANPGFGIQFKRVDLPNQPIIKADCDLVTDTSRGTTLQLGDAKVSTVEHILAALTGMGVDNVLIEINGPEIPIMDGSSKPFTDLLDEGTVVEQQAAKAWYSIDENIEFFDNEKRVEMVALPSYNYSLTTLIDFNSPVLGTQHASLNNIRDFETEIAPCRTFSFLHELEMLVENNLIKGGDINNAIVIVDKEVDENELARLRKIFGREDIQVRSGGYLDNLELRFPNEAARHKLLDVVGDLTLIGYPIKTRIIANRPGHRTNIEFAKKIKQYIKKNQHTKDIPVYDAMQQPVFRYEEIIKFLPHRAPFLLVDKVTEITDTYIVAVKNVTINEYFFEGHFPDNPVMPGVLQLEAIAQTGGIFCINHMPKGKYDTYFLKIDNCKFKQKVLPGDTLVIKTELLEPIRRGLCVMKGTAYVLGKVATEALMVAQIVRVGD